VSEDKTLHEATDWAAPESGPETADAPRLRQRGSNQIGMRQFNDRVVCRHCACTAAPPRPNWRG
jgi:hypothetical protein